MNNHEITIDLVKFLKYIWKHIWIPILLAVIGFAVLYWQAAFRTLRTYTASGTMYVYNGNPNLMNYQYTSSSDLDSAVQLIDTYMIVVRSNKVMDVIVERLSKDYPGIPSSFVSASLSMASVSETGVVRVSSVTFDPQLSADICNAVLDVAPSEIIRVVGAGNIEIIDYATKPEAADSTRPLRRGMRGGAIGGIIGGSLLLLLFLMNHKIMNANDLTENYTPPILSTIPRQKKDNPDASTFLLTKMSPMELIESYARLRMNLLYTLAGKENHVVVITSAVTGEGKSTIAAGLAMSCAMGGKKVILVDSDLRRACQKDMFKYSHHAKGLSEALVGEIHWQDAVLKVKDGILDLLPAGHLPPNPAEVLETEMMLQVLREMQEAYDLVLLDMPPINIVTDPLLLSSHVAGCLFVVRQNYTNHADLRDSLNAAQITGMNVLGFAFYGEKVDTNGYYSRKYRKNYYNKYDNRNRLAMEKENAGHHEEYEEKKE